MHASTAYDNHWLSIERQIFHLKKQAIHPGYGLKGAGILWNSLVQRESEATYQPKTVWDWTNSYLAVCVSFTYISLSQLQLLWLQLIDINHRISLHVQCHACLCCNINLRAIEYLLLRIPYNHCNRKSMWKLQLGGGDRAHMSSPACGWTV